MSFRVQALGLGLVLVSFLLSIGLGEILHETPIFIQATIVVYEQLKKSYKLQLYHIIHTQE